MESYHDGIFPSLISQGENSSKLLSFLHVFLNVKIYRCLLGESKCCKRASSLVKEIHEFRLPLRQWIRARTSGVGKSCCGDFRIQTYNFGISEKRLPTQGKEAWFVWGITVWESSSFNEEDVEVCFLEGTFR